MEKPVRTILIIYIWLTVHLPDLQIYTQYIANIKICNFVLHKYYFVTLIHFAKIVV